MVNNHAPQRPIPEPCKIVHNCITSIHHVSSSAVLTATLQTLEQRLQKRNLLRLKGLSNFFPVWFLAETERNIFLWRNGFSLVEQDRFEFWVEPIALIQKRLTQIDSFCSDNPFLNPLWGAAAVDPETAAREKEYLNDFLDCFERIHLHMHGLSRAASDLRHELEPHTSRNIVVLLEKNHQQQNQKAALS